jgi:hypothetical protein
VPDFRSPIPDFRFRDEHTKTTLGDQEAGKKQTFKQSQGCGTPPAAQSDSPAAAMPFSTRDLDAYRRDERLGHKLMTPEERMQLLKVSPGCVIGILVSRHTAHPR